MSVLNKLRREVEEKSGLWKDYIAHGKCKTFDEYLQSVATLQTCYSFINDINEAIEVEMNEGSEDEQAT